MRDASGPGEEGKAIWFSTREETLGKYNTSLEPGIDD
jgi:hypothetical protein